MSNFDRNELAAFAQLAQGFCAWCEGSSGDEISNVRAAYWLGLLYSQALLLPKVGQAYYNDFPEIPVESLSKAQANLAKFIGWYYREVFNPDPFLTDDPCMGDVGDDLMDTYLEIRRGLILFECGEVGDALWHWSRMHRDHWGRHAVGALSALHCLAISQE